MGKRGKKISADIKDEVRLLNSQFFFQKDIARVLNISLTTVRHLLREEDHLKMEDYLEANRLFLKELYINGASSKEMQLKLAVKNRNAKYDISPRLCHRTIAKFCSAHWKEEKKQMSSILDGRVATEVEKNQLSGGKIMKTLRVGTARYKRVKDLHKSNSAALTSDELLEQLSALQRVEVNEDGLCQKRCLTCGRNVMLQDDAMRNLMKDIAKIYKELSEVESNKAVMEFYWGDESADMDVFFGIWEQGNLEIIMGNRSLWGNRLTLALFSVLIQKQVIVFTKNHRSITRCTPLFEAISDINDLVIDGHFNVDMLKECIILEFDDRKEHYNLICSRDEIHRSKPRVAHYPKRNDGRR